ncbi:MAG: hypothetical protein ACR2JV_01975 [Gaiellales bacterium]
MTSYTTKSAYPYPDPSDQVADYPTIAGTLATYLDNLPNRNRIINCQFDIWQRGTSFSNPANGAYTADRWVFTQNGTGGTRTISQVTSTLGTLYGGMQARQVLLMSITNAGSPAATSQTIGQRIEDVRTYASEAVTFSAYVTNLAVAGITTATVKAIQNFGTGGTPSTAVTTTLGTITIGSTWARVSLTGTLPSISGKTIGTNNDSYVEFQIDVGGATGSLYLWGVQVEQGVTRTALERIGIGEEVRRCQRYFVKSYRVDITPGTSTNDGMYSFYGVTQGGSLIVAYVPFPTSMRTAPATITFYRQNGANNNWVYARNGAGGDFLPGTTDVGTNSFSVNTGNLGAAWTPCVIYGHWSASAEL